MGKAVAFVEKDRSPECDPRVEVVPTPSNPSLRAVLGVVVWLLVEDQRRGWCSLRQASPRIEPTRISRGAS